MEATGLVKGSGKRKRSTNSNEWEEGRCTLLPLIAPLTLQTQRKFPFPFLLSFHLTRGIISETEFIRHVDASELEAERAREESSFMLGWLVRC